MKNYVQPGNTVTLIAPYAVLSGEGALVGSLFGVATGDVANAVEGEFALDGVFKLAKATGAGTAIAQGAKAYWDNAAKKVTGVASGNTHIGYGIVASIDGDVVATVKLLF